MPVQPDFPVDAFGDSFDLARLPLPRQARGYAVQMLDTDRLLDRRTNELLPVRSTALDALFPSFGEAHAAAVRWATDHGHGPDTHALAIVPAGYDDRLERHILIYGVLCAEP